VTFLHTSPRTSRTPYCFSHLIRSHHTIALSLGFYNDARFHVPLAAHCYHAELVLRQHPPHLLACTLFLDGDSIDIKFWIPSSSLPAPLAARPMLVQRLRRPETRMKIRQTVSG